MCQNKMARFVLGLNARAHIGQENQEIIKLKWLPIEKRVAQLKLHPVHKITYNRAPEYLSEIFAEYKTNPVHETRNNSLKYKLPDMRSKLSRTSFLHTGIKEWNSLPGDIKSLENFNSFKINVKKHLSHELLRTERQDFIFY